MKLKEILRELVSKETYSKVRELASYDYDTLKKMLLEGPLPEDYALPFGLLLAIVLIVIVFFIFS